MKRNGKLAVLLVGIIATIAITATAQEQSFTPESADDLADYLEGSWELYQRYTPDAQPSLIARYNISQESETRFVGRGTAAYGGFDREVEIVLDVERADGVFRITGFERIDPDSASPRTWNLVRGEWDPAVDPFFFRLLGYYEGHADNERLQKKLEFLRLADAEPWIHFDDTEQATLYTIPDQTIGYLAVEPALWQTLIDPDNQNRLNTTLTEILLDMIAPTHDFFTVVLDLETRPERMAYGTYRSYQRDATGIRDVRTARRPEWLPEGSPLKGSMMLSYRTGISRGPFLHEILHQWGSGYDALFQPPARTARHWGAASVYGQLGGFKRETLEQIGPNRFRAAYFSFNANGGNGVRYSPLELYIMGLVGSEDVPDIWVGTDAVNVARQRGPDGFTEFTVESHLIITIEDIIARYGPRLPSAGESQREFRLLPVLVGPAPREDNAQFLHDVYDFTFLGDNHRPLYNFWEATGERASLVLTPVERAR